MKYILAISGGVDSSVLLDMVAKKQMKNLSLEDIVIAHFDHGIREESVDDAEFVKKLANEYKFKFVLGREELGKNASEKIARKARYSFLRSISKHREYYLVTAHHQDDLLETILMNILRGTGWRGLSPMWSKDIMRPLLEYSKADLIEYAIKNKLEWVEDETNYSSKYFRNRVRDVLYVMDPKLRQKMIKLYNKQKNIRKEIEDILNDLSVSPNLHIEKKQIEELPDKLAIEILRKWTDNKLTYPQLNKLLNDIKNAKGGIDIQPGNRLLVKIRKGSLSLGKI